MSKEDRIHSALEHVKSFIELRDPIATKLEVRYPFRRLFGHVYRTYLWARRINVIEPGDPEVVELAAIFHDVGKCVDNSSRGHAEASAEVCGSFLTSLGLEQAKQDLVCRIVREHAHWSEGGWDVPERRIVRDADILDEVGAMTAVWDCLSVGAQGAQSYEEAYEKVRGSYLDLADKTRELRTGRGRLLYEERLIVLRSFTENLAYELGRKSDLRPTQREPGDREPEK